MIKKLFRDYILHPFRYYYWDTMMWGRDDKAASLWKLEAGLHHSQLEICLIDTKTICS